MMNPEVEKRLMRNQADILLGLAILMQEITRSRSDQRILDAAMTFLATANKIKDDYPK